MMAADVEDLCGKRHARDPERRYQQLQKIQCIAANSTDGN
jgi:hypothetical protein